MEDAGGIAPSPSPVVFSRSFFWVMRGVLAIGVCSGGKTQVKERRERERERAVRVLVQKKSGVSFWKGRGVCGEFALLD